MTLPPPGESSALPDNLIDQIDIETGAYSLEEIRRTGGIIFTAALNRFDGLGDGPPNIFDSTRSFPFRGDRPTLQTGMTAMLRIYGLDARSCLECQAIVSSTEVPPRLGIGGHGGISNSAMSGTQLLEVDNPDGNGVVDTTGRVINPPFFSVPVASNYWLRTGSDADGDGIRDELTIGEMSALSVFLATIPRPRAQSANSDAKKGKQLLTFLRTLKLPKQVDIDKLEKLIRDGKNSQE